MSPFFWDKAPCQWVMGAQHFKTVIECFYPLEDEITMLSQNVRHQSPINKVPHPRRRDITFTTAEAYALKFFFALTCLVPSLITKVTSSFLYFFVAMWK